MLPIKLFRLVSCLFRYNRNIETLCFDIEAKQPKQTFFVSDNAETSFGSSFGCFESKLVSKDTLVRGFLTNSVCTVQYSPRKGQDVNYGVCTM